MYFLKGTPPTDVHTLSLHDALPIYRLCRLSAPPVRSGQWIPDRPLDPADLDRPWGRSEEHTSELQSRFELVCRLLLEKKMLLDFEVLFPAGDGDFDLRHQICLFERF